MANKRSLKKEIRYICGDIAVESMLASDMVKDIDPRKLGEIIEHVANLQINALKNASFAFDKTPSDFENRKAYNAARHAYFKKAYASFHTDFNKELQSIVKSMNALFPHAKPAAAK